MSQLETSGCCQSSTSESPVLDPRKRVRYVHGLVLGVDEMQQEQYAWLEKQRLHHRALHGYGTVLGLDLGFERDSENRPIVRVSPGIAVGPHGRDICVDREQCGDLDRWLRAHWEGGGGADPSEQRRAIEEALAGSPGTLEAWLVLCHRECATDFVPIPGGPCRTPEDSSEASRITESFAIDVVVSQPEQQEEEAVDRFGDLLRSIEITDQGSVFVTAEELEQRVRDLIEGAGVATSPPIGPSSPDVLRLHPLEAEAALRRAFLVWITEVRPRLAAASGHCESGPSSEDCVLLARLTIPIAAGGDGVPVVTGDATPDESERPFLLHTRLLQELLGHGATVLIGSQGSGPGPVVSPPVASPPVQGVTDHGDLTGLTDPEDHPQYLTLTADRALTGANPLDIGGARVVNVAAGAANNDVLVFGQNAGGDLTGTYPDPRIGSIQTRPVDLSGALNPDDLLRWDGAAWRPSTGPGERNLTRIDRFSWAHGGATIPFITIDGTLVAAIAVVTGRAVAPVRVRVNDGTPDSVNEQTFEVFAEAPSPGVPDTVQIVRLQPRAIIGVEPIGGSTTQFNSAGVGSPATAFAFLFSRAWVDLLVSQLGGIVNLRIVIHGDFILDDEGRPIDAEHLRNTTDGTGDHPPGPETVGIRGGRFESWTEGRFSQQLINLNTASTSELRSLPGIGARHASRIRSMQGNLTSLDDLRGVLPQSTIDAIRALVTF